MIAQQATLFDVQPSESFVDREALGRALLAPHVAIDVETDTEWKGVGPSKDYGLSYCADITHIALVWMEQGEGITGTVLIAPFDQDTRDALTKLVSSAHTIIGHNLVFDIRQLSRLTGGNTPDITWCTQTMARLLHPQAQDRYDLISVAAALGLGSTELQRATKSKRADLHKMPRQQLMEYVLADAVLAYSVWEKQQTYIADEQTFMLADWECRAVAEYCRMAAQGVRLNIPYVKQRVLELGDLIQQTAQRLKADGLTKPNSPQERVKYIYEKKGIPKPDPDKHPDFYTPKGGLSASADVIMALLDQFPEHADKLRDLALYINADRMLATHQSLLDHAAADGRIHALVSINTQAGRRSASHPQVQNWKMAAGHDDPVGDMCGVAIGDDGFTLVEIDYSNAENWIAAMLSGDDNLAAACAAEDFHSAMAQQYFGQQWEQVDKDERKRLRRMGKIITFGTAYGMGPKKLALSLGIEYDQAVNLLATKNAAFWGVAQTKKLAEDKAISTGCINLWTGRKVPVDASQTYTAWNYLCQGGVAEMVKRSIVLINEAYYERGMASRVALDMHDAIILEVAHIEWDTALAIASEVMQTVIPNEMNQRTTPPIQWIAQPNPEENQKKWGKFQWHPGGDMPEGVEGSASEADARLADLEIGYWLDEDFNLYEIPYGELGMAQSNHHGPFNTSEEALVAQKELRAKYAPANLPAFDPAPEPASIPLIKLAYADMDFTWQLRVRPGVKFTDLTPKERGEWRAFFNAFWNKLDQETERTFEVVVPQNGALRRVSVNRVNYIKVLELWAAQPQIPAEVGLSTDTMKTELDTHQTFMKLVEKRVQGCLTWLNALEGEGHE